ncbi:hypothetical protein BYT27DRAFT_7084956 [Phlegmacium glaucopus]|nr:hypothetical protein BYT27DRAFT_7084956 [Phlegmacium glaucopus]
MLSGTSIKAVISYVTDYISKPVLKTHQIFSTAYNILDKNSKLEHDDPSQTDDARKIILKIVNALSTKMEIGSPMAAMYLLQNPDHYTSHKFIPFWWKSFVHHIRNSDSNNNTSIVVEENIDNLFQDKIKPLSHSEEQMDLDEHAKNTNTIDASYNDNEMDIDHPKLFIGGGEKYSDENIHIQQHDSNEEIEYTVNAKQKTKDPTYLQFLPGHTQRNTHKVKCIPSRSNTYILNFIGGSLPRRDKGDLGYYCSTMLTLFKPWRSSQDLKNIDQTWTEAFALYEFNIENKKIMNNFNLCYECLDERDDYHAILKKQSNIEGGEKTSSTIANYNDNFGINSNFEEDYGDQNILGPITIKKTQQMIEMEMMMNQAGWLAGSNRRYKITTKCL